MPTTRQLFLAFIIKKAAEEQQVIAFVPTAGLRNAVDTAGFSRRTSSDGNDEIVADQAAFLGAAIESAVLGQPALARAVFNAEKARYLSFLSGKSSTLQTNKTQVDSEITSVTNETL